MSLYLGDSLISQLYVGTTAANTTNITLSTPTLSVNSSTGVVTATVTQSNAGYLVPSSTSNTLQLTTQAAATITPTAARQTAVAAGKYTIGEVAVAAVPTETKTVTSNGTYSPTSGKFFSSVTVNVPVGSTINNQDKTVTPTTSSQSVSADYGYTGLGLVTVNAIPSEYLIPTGNKQITSNGTNIDVAEYATVSVNISTVNNQNKTVTPSTTTQTITADTGYTGLGTVTVNAIQTETKSATPSTSAQTITPSSGKYLTRVTVNAIPSQYIIPSGSQTVTTNDTYDVTNLASLVVNVPVGSTINNQAKTATPTESQQEITADSGYTGLSKVTISAISPIYVGSGITRRSSTDLTASGATVSVPAGYYSAAASKAVASGTAGTPTATKGTVSNNSISVTPSVTNTTGYITGGTNTGTAVTVSASELVSGNKAITSNGTGIDVTNYATVSVDVPTGGGGITPTGNLSITENGTNIDVTNYATVSVAVPSQGVTVVDTTDEHGGTIRTISATTFYGQAYTLDDFAMRNFSGSITLPTATRIGACTFAGSNITEIHAPNVTQFYSNTASTGLGVFQNCKSLTVVDLPNFTTCGSGGYQFAGDTALVHVFFPKGSTGQHMFDGCSNLETAVLGGTGQMNQNDYSNCSKLTIVDTRNSRVYNSSFSNCTKLTTLIIRRTSLCTLSNINAFSNTPFASGKAGGTLYVPEDLIASYQAASNWSTILGYENNQIKSIESTHTDPNAFLDLTLYYGDGTPL